MSDTYVYLNAAALPATAVEDCAESTPVDVASSVSYVEEEMEVVDDIPAQSGAINMDLFDDEIPSEYWASPTSYHHAPQPLAFPPSSTRMMGMMQTPSPSSDDGENLETRMGRRGRSWGRVGIVEPEHVDPSADVIHVRTLDEMYGPGVDEESYDVRGLRGAFVRAADTDEDEDEDENEDGEVEVVSQAGDVDTPAWYSSSEAEAASEMDEEDDDEEDEQEDKENVIPPPQPTRQRTFFLPQSSSRTHVRLSPEAERGRKRTAAASGNPLTVRLMSAHQSVTPRRR